MRRLYWLAALPLFLTLPAAAQAQTMVTPLVGAAIDKDTLDRARSTYGVSAAYWSTLPLGVELEFAYLPDFFPAQHPDGDHHVVGDVSTFSANVILGVPHGGAKGAGVRPYVSGGLVVFNIMADEPRSRFSVRGVDPGFNVGGGVIAMLGEHIGFRGDARYVKNPRGYVDAHANDPEHGARVGFGGFSYTRFTAGLVVRF